MRKMRYATHFLRRRKPQTFSIVSPRPTHSQPCRSLTCLKVSGMKRVGENGRHSDARLFSEHASHGTLMTATALSHMWSPFSPLLFAREVDQDLDFEDDLDEFDDPRQKPPRRWLRFILIILLAVGTWYVMTDPELRSSVAQMVNTVRHAIDSFTQDPVPPPEPKVRPPAPEIPPVPAFHEGQQVTVASREDHQARFRLRSGVEGEPVGPFVKTGDTLTILDGSLIKKRWVYLVQTHSGDSGWIKDMHLKPLP